LSLRKSCIASFLHLNTLSPRLPATSEDQPQQEAKAESCGASKSSLTGLPIERIDAVLRPTSAQKGALDRLSAATKKAVHELQAACPDEVPVTPSTLAKKSADTPLLETGEMRDSIECVVTAATVSLGCRLFPIMRRAVR